MMCNKAFHVGARGIRVLFVIGLGFLLMGTVVKRKNAIQMTQTDPVSVQEKLKEDAEGKKGPPAPSLKLFPKERFLIEGPMEKGKKNEGAEQEMATSAVFVETPEETEEFKVGEATDDTSHTSENISGDGAEETWDFDEEGVP